MYKITIKTKYNVINLEVEDYNTPQLQEVYSQPYVQEISIENLDKHKIKKLDLPKK